MLSNNRVKFLNTTFIVLSATVLIICLCAGVVWAALSTKYNNANDDNFQDIDVARLSSSVTTNTITVTNDMPCVMRVSPLNSTVENNLRGDATNWTEQYNGWYYYNSILTAVDTDTPNHAITVNGVAEGNVIVELMQANYGYSSGTIPSGGFIIEWGPWNFDKRTSPVVHSTYTTDGVYLDDFVGLYIAAFLGNTTIGSLEGSDNYNLKVSGGVLQGNATDSADTGWATISNTNALRVYNNATMPMIVTFTATADNTNDISSLFTTTGWTVATSGKTLTCTMSAAVLPGEYIALLNSASATAAQSIADTQFRINVSAVDSVSYYTSIDTSTDAETHDPYLNWLRQLGGTYLTDYQSKVTDDGGSVSVNADSLKNNVSNVTDDTGNTNEITTEPTEDVTETENITETTETTETTSSTETTDTAGTVDTTTENDITDNIGNL